MDPPTLRPPRGVRLASSLKFEERSGPSFFKTLSYLVRGWKRHTSLRFSQKADPDVDDGYTNAKSTMSNALYSSFFCSRQSRIRTDR